MSNQERLNQLNGVKGKEETNYVEEMKRGSQKKSEAEKDIEDDKMNSQLENIASEISNLLRTMLRQLEKEDIQREKMIGFFMIFTILITLIPFFAIIVLILLLKGQAGIVENIMLLCAFINVPVSTIGVLRSIAKCLFNDTYRSTLPDMIRNIIEALSRYNTVYRGKENNKKDP